MRIREIFGVMAALAAVLALPTLGRSSSPGGTGTSQANVMAAMAADLPGGKADAAAGYAGIKTCRECHKRNVDSFLHSVHGKSGDRRTPASQHACESCHGPGAAHAEDPYEKSPGVRIIKFTAKTQTRVADRNAMCLNCHGKMRTHVFWQGSVHEQRGLACTSCHLLHGGNHRLLREARQMDVCFKCHQRQKSEVQMAYHHPIREGEMVCTDCHNPHGAIGDKLITAATVNEKCFQCHADKRGPFVWNHSPVVESCLNCHNPHGSRHDFLLVARAPWLCQRCHSGEGHQGIMYANNMFKAPAGAANAQPPASNYFLRPQAYGRSCWQCHVAIHGSQSPSGNTFLR